MRRVVLESPYRELPGEDPLAGRARNARYRQACIRDCLRRGEAPFASHQMYTDALDDDEPAERQLGMEAGFAWHGVADGLVVYTDLGIRPGMERGIERFEEGLRGRLILPEYRQLGPGWDIG